MKIRTFQQQVAALVKTIHALPENVDQAMVLALNRVAEWLKGQVSKTASKKLRIKLKLIREKMQVIKAHRESALREGSRALIKCNFQGIRAIDLGNPKQNEQGVVIGSRLLFRHAFIAHIRWDATQGVYQRIGKARFPVKASRLEIYTECANLIDELLGSEAKAVFEKRFEHELQRLTGGVI